jgi:hypothetical protein
VTPWLHAKSSAKKYGGNPADYIELHDWFDETKQYTSDFTHRALRHHSAGVQWAVEKFGHVIQNVDGKWIPTKALAEKHIEEDCGFVPTPKDWLRPIEESPCSWMLKVKIKSTKELEVA